MFCLIIIYVLLNSKADSLVLLKGDSERFFRSMSESISLSNKASMHGCMLCWLAKWPCQVPSSS
jgi:hypothetical protein